MAENGIWAAFRGQNKRHTWQGMVNTSIKVIVYIKLEVRKYQINQKWAIVVNFVLQSHQIVENEDPCRVYFRAKMKGSRVYTRSTGSSK